MLRVSTSPGAIKSRLMSSRSHSAAWGSISLYQARGLRMAAGLRVPGVEAQTLPTLPRAGRRYFEVIAAKNVPAFARGLPRVLTDHSPATAHVLPVGNGLHMRRVYAPRRPALVVDLCASGYRSVGGAVRQSVCLLRAEPVPHLAVASRNVRPQPKPAPRIRLGNRLLLDPRG